MRQAIVRNILLGYFEQHSRPKVRSLCLLGTPQPDIPINSICKGNPYDDIETLPELPSDTEKRNITSHKNAYISDQTARIQGDFYNRKCIIRSSILRTTLLVYAAKYFNQNPRAVGLKLSKSTPSLV